MLWLMDLSQANSPLMSVTACRSPSGSFPTELAGVGVWGGKVLFPLALASHWPWGGQVVFLLVLALQQGWGWGGGQYICSLWPWPHNGVGGQVLFPSALLLLVLAMTVVLRWGWGWGDDHPDKRPPSRITSFFLDSFHLTFPAKWTPDIKHHSYFKAILLGFYSGFYNICASVLRSWKIVVVFLGP